MQLQPWRACLGEFLGVKHVLLCASGTEALMVALFALGLEPGDEVIMLANKLRCPLRMPS